jgi:hypothetical protein
MQDDEDFEKFEKLFKKLDVNDNHELEFSGFKNLK